jgi:TolB protein
MFTRDVSGFQSTDGRQLDAHILLINIETKEVRDVSGNKPDGTNDLYPRISPDGAKIIFMNVSNDGTGKKSIWIMNKTGSERKILVEDSEMPCWQ